MHLMDMIQRYKIHKTRTPLRTTDIVSKAARCSLARDWLSPALGKNPAGVARAHEARFHLRGDTVRLRRAGARRSLRDAERMAAAVNGFTAPMWAELEAL